MNQFKRVGFGGSGGGSSAVKPSVATAASLPLTGNTINDLRYVVSEETFYRWDGSVWVPQRAQTSKYATTFNSASWTNSGGEFVFEVPQTTHLKGTSPIVEVSELDAGQYSSVIVTIDIDNNGNVRLIVPSSPDLRFEGKLTIA